MSESPVHRVVINGVDYVLRSSDSSEYVNKLACYVDEKMRELGRQGIVSSNRQAVLAALGIADELFRAREGGAEPQGQICVPGELEQLISEIDAVLQQGEQED